MLLANDGVQIGVVSTVPKNCANPDESKSVFTSVSRNLPWIRSIMFGDKMMDQVVSISATFKPETVTGYYKQIKNDS